MTAAHFFQQWWVTGILVPLLFGLPIAACVNLWAGFFAADLVATRNLLHEAGFYLASFQSISTHEERKRTHFSAIKISSYTFALRGLNQPEAADLVGQTFKTAVEAWQRIQAHESDAGINDMEHPYSQDIAEIAFAALALIEAKPNLRRLAFGRIGHLVQSLWTKSIHH